jgi:hypothetical protein
VERQIGGDGLGPKGAGIFFFIDQFDSAHPDAVVIEVELLGVVHGMADLDFVADIGRGDLVDSPFEADSGIVIDQSFVSNEEDLIEFGPGKSADGDP